MPEQEDNNRLYINLREDEVYQPPFIDEDGEPKDKDDILDGIDLDRDLKDVGDFIKQGLNRVYEKDDGFSEGEPNIVPPLMPKLPPPMSNNPDDILSVSVSPNGLLQRNIEDPTENDRLYHSIRNNDSTSSVLNNIMAEIAEEAAYLKTWRKENFNLSEDISEVSNKRILILKKLVDTIEKKEKISNSKSTGKVDFHSDNFQKVFSHFLQVVKSTFEEVNIPAQYEDIFFSQLAKSLDGFEDTAEKIYHGKKVKK
jgi:hypothetical protein